MLYKVTKGDTLSNIAVQFSTNVHTLVELNDIQNPDKIYPGQLLMIPEKPESKDDRVRKQLIQALEDIEKLPSVRKLLSLL